MDQKKWHDKFVFQLVSRGLDQEEALDTLDGNMGDYDYESDPEDAADEELSYWTDDDEA